VAGWLSLFSGDYPGALPLCEESVALFKELGHEADGARTKIALGTTSAVLGKEEGPRIVSEALTACRERGDGYGTALALTALGELSRATGDHAQARTCYEQALELLRELGNTYWLGLLMHNLSHLHIHEGDWKGAAELLVHTVELGQEFNYPMAVNLYLAAMGSVAVMRGRAEEGIRLFGAADAFLQSLGAAFEPTDQAVFDRHISAAKMALGEVAFQAAWKQGAQWTREEAIAATLPLRS